jgi:undecaprenyl-diphosphatase
MQDIQLTANKSVLSRLLKWDQLIARHMVDLVFQFNIRKIARSVSMLGDGYLYVALVWLIYMLDPLHATQLASSVVMAFAIERPLYFVLKNLICRPRPGNALPGFPILHTASDEFSLPSGHTSAAFLFATILAQFYPAFFPLFFILAGLIGLSRILLGVHYPSDIAAGMVLGCLSALFAIQYHSALFL